MRKAEKTIERINSILDKAIEELTEELIDTEATFNDTGYDRHYKKMIRLQEDIDTLENFRHTRHLLNEARREAEKERRIRAIFERKLDGFEQQYPGDEYIREIIKRCKEKLKTEEKEAN